MKEWLISGLLLALSLMVPVHAKNKLTLILTNAQGTVVAEKVPNGAVTYTAAYRPYGRQQVGAPEAGPGYTGHVNDLDTGVVYMQARYYDPSGRFLSVDPIGPAPGNIFSFSRYAYANNNPITYSDPTGMVSDGDCSAACVFMRRVSDKFNGIRSSILSYTNSHADPTSPTGQLDMVNGYSAASAAGVAASFSSDASSQADLVPGATLTACTLNGGCSIGQWAMGGFMALPEGAAEGLVSKASFGAESALQAAKLWKYYDQVAKYGGAAVKELESGVFRFYGILKPASNPGEMAGARLVREWDPASGATRTWYETLDHAGTVRSVAPKPGLTSLNHRIFDASGKYVGRR